MQVELGTAQRGETLRLPAPANRILIRPGFIFELYSTGKVTNKLTDAVKCEQALLLTVRVDRERPMDIAHLAVCRLQRANNRFSCMKNSCENWKMNGPTKFVERKLCMGRCDASSLAASTPRDSCTSEFVGVRIQTEVRRL